MWRIPERRVRASGGFWLLLGWFAWANGWQMLVMVLGAAAIHELGHWLVLRHWGVQTACLRLTVFGAEMISASAGLSYGKELAAVLAGPLANLLWGLLLAWLGGPWLVPAGANLVLCAFNLLPVRPLDGGRALELLVSWAAGPAAGERAARWSGIAAALLSTAALWAVMDRSGGSLWLLPAAGGMLAAAMREFWGGALKKHYF